MPGDHRDAPAPDVLEIPVERLRVPGLARAAEDAQGGEVVLRRDLISVSHEASDKRRRDAEHSHLVLLDHPPQPVRRRMVGCSLVKNHRRAEDERAEDEPGAHHPTHVRVPEHDVIRADVKAVRHVLRRLDRKSAVHVQRALGFAGRARRVDDHQGVLGVQLLGASAVGVVLQEHLPDLVASVRPRNLPHHPPVDDHLLHRWAADQGAVSGLLHGHYLAAAVEAVRADQHLRLTVAQTRRDRLRAVAREQWNDDRPDFRRREHGNRNLGTHRHEDSDAVALPDTHPTERSGKSRSLPVELRIRELADVTRFAFPDDRGLVPELAVSISIEAAFDDVHPPADPPPGPRFALRHVDNLVVLPREGDADVLHGGVPEPFDVVVGPPQQLVIGLDSVAVHEAFQAASRDHFWARLPDHVSDHHRLHGFNCPHMTGRELPDDFADSLNRVLDPRHQEAAAEIIEAATMLDDVGLRRFLHLFAERVRASDAPIRADELREYLQQAARAKR